MDLLARQVYHYLRKILLTKAEAIRKCSEVPIAWWAMVETFNIHRLRPHVIFYDLTIIGK
jgi:hypothetical protein